MELSNAYCMDVDLRQDLTDIMHPNVDSGREHHYTQHRTAHMPSRNAVRERTRVRSLRSAFQCLQRRLPSVPPNTKLSKLDVLILATNYIAQLRRTLADTTDNALQLENSLCIPESRHLCEEELREDSFLHPVKKWPMRSRLYAGAAAHCNTVASQSLSDSIVFQK